METRSTRANNMDSEVSTLPVSPEERIGELDVLRGLALFGMLLVNTGSLGGYWRFPERWTGVVDRITMPTVAFLAEDKFFSLFAFLFGVGFAIQIGRAELRGSRFIPVYLRRQIGLMLIGVLALIFLAPVLILQTYALVGIVLLQFRNYRPQTLLSIVLLCLLIPAAGEAVVMARTTQIAISTQTEQQLIVEEQEIVAEQASWQSEGPRLHSEGTYRELMGWRMRFAKTIYVWPAHYLNMLGSVLPTFLLGLWVGRRRIFKDLSTHLPFVRKVLWWGMAIGFGGTLASVALRGWFDFGNKEVTEPLATLFWSFGKLGLCFFYSSGLVILFQRLHWKRRLTPLAAVGRMALSNYLLQLLVFAIVFPAYGLGLYGRIGPAMCIAFSILVFAGQILWSIWWVARFRYGPIEWLWRAFTYGKRAPIRLSPQ